MIAPAAIASVPEYAKTPHTRTLPLYCDGARRSLVVGAHVRTFTATQRREHAWSIVDGQGPTLRCVRGIVGAAVMAGTGRGFVPGTRVPALALPHGCARREAIRRI